MQSGTGLFHAVRNGVISRSPERGYFTQSGTGLHNERGQLLQQGYLGYSKDKNPCKAT